MHSHIGEVRQALIGRFDVINSTLETRFDSLPQEPLGETQERPERQAEELPEERPEERLDEPHDKQSDKPTEKLSKGQSEELPEEQSKGQSDEHNSRMSSFEGPNYSSNIRQARYIPRLPPSPPAINIRAIDEQAIREQIQAHLLRNEPARMTRMTQILTERQKLQNELAHFINTKKLRPSQLTNFVVLVALFLLGSQGLLGRSDVAQERMAGKGRGDLGDQGDQMREEEVQMGGV